MVCLEKEADRYRSLFHALRFDVPWDRVSGAVREEILREAEAASKLPWPMRPATGFLAFSRSGSRKADEDPYFLRRRKLCWAVLACGLGETRYLDDVVDGVWCICEETSWVISAHNVNPIPGAPSAAEYPLPDPEKPYIDLFSAQTGMILALTAQLAGDSLDQVSPMLRERIRREIRRRILDPFMNTDDFWWMGFRRKDLCNWTPWIVSNVMICALAQPLGPGLLPELLIRACGMLDRWLAVVPPDGGCDEGAGYWNMAGGALLDCLELLESATDGVLSCWQDEKIRNILSFPGKAEIGGGFFLNFADCDAVPFLSGERIQTAGEKLGDPSLAALGLRLRRSPGAELSDVPHFSRLLKALTHPYESPKETGASAPLPGKSPEDVWLPDLQVRLVRRGGWTLACKGGHNGENHNHNDVGSFMLYLDGAPEIVDAGNMTYTAKTFSDRRYELWNTRSGYHNVPLIGMFEQAAGAEYRASEVEFLPDGLRLDLAKSYPSGAGVLRCLRTLNLDPDGLSLTDRITLSEAAEVSWIFLLRNRPEQADGQLRFGKLRLEVPAGWKTVLEEIPITDPRMARVWPGSLWRVRITDSAAPEHSASWRFVSAASVSR